MVAASMTERAHAHCASGVVSHKHLMVESAARKRVLLELENREENLGAQVARQAVERTRELAGSTMRCRWRACCC
jgi:hypothetical protein